MADFIHGPSLGANHKKKPEPLLRQMLWPLSHFCVITRLEIDIEHVDDKQVLNLTTWTPEQTCKGLLVKSAEVYRRIEHVQHLLKGQKEPRPHLNIDDDCDRLFLQMREPAPLDPVREDRLHYNIVKAGKGFENILSWRQGKISTLRHFGISSEPDASEEWQEIEAVAAEVRDWDETILLEAGKRID